MKKLLIAVVCLLSIFGLPAFSQENSKTIYKDATAPIPNRVRDLLDRMTVEEKVAQLESNWTLPAFPGFTAPSPFEGDHLNEAIVKKMAANGLGTFAQLDEFMGTGGPANPRLGAKKRNLLQEWWSRTHASVFRFSSTARHSTVRWCREPRRSRKPWAWEAHGIPN